MVWVKIVSPAQFRAPGQLAELLQPLRLHLHLGSCIGRKLSTAKMCENVSIGYTERSCPKKLSAAEPSAAEASAEGVQDMS